MQILLRSQSVDAEVNIKMKVNINSQLGFIIGFLLPLPLKFTGINLYAGELVLLVFIIMNTNKICNFFSDFKSFLQIWIWNYFLIICISVYGMFIGDFALHLKSAFQYGVCLLIIFPGFSFLIFYYKKTFLYGSYFGLLISCTFLSYAYFADIYLFKEFFSYNVTGGFFKRMGLTSVNDYAIMLLVCSFIIISFEEKLIFKFSFLLITLYLILMTGSRVSIVGFMLLIILANHAKRVNLPQKLIVSTITMTLLILSYEHVAGLSRLMQNSIYDSERHLLFIDGINFLNSYPLGTGLLQYFNPKNGYPVHNFYLLALIELGIFWGLLFVLSIIVTLCVCVDFKPSIRAVPLIILLMIFSTITHTYDKFLWYFPGIVLSITMRLRQTNSYLMHGEGQTSA